MTEQKNILFIMCDQLRYDYLSCYGHKHLDTPNIDRLAEMGVRFEHAYVQAPQCGPSRASIYTGRNMTSHGSNWNRIPLRPSEKTLGDYLKDLGYRTAVVGKTHMRPDLETYDRLKIDVTNPDLALAIQAGFEPFERDDGLNPMASNNLNYNKTLKEKGYTSENPWLENANSVVTETGEIKNGWLLENAGFPANIKEEDSETAYMTTRAMQFIDEAGSQPWCLHLSYIKPHWPYVAPAPYHAIYSEEDIQDVQRSEIEKENTHPVFAHFMNQAGSQTMAQDETRAKVIPTYMGLVKQIDDHMGRLLEFLDEKNLLTNTMIVFTSDHGDYLGDHFLIEKLLFHDPSVRVPLIIYDPSPKADKTRGTVSKKLAESIDLVPSFIDFAGGKLEDYEHRLEGASLLPIIRSQAVQNWREYAVSEIDFHSPYFTDELDLPDTECRAYMLFDKQFKYIFYEHFRPQLFDLQADPYELIDLGESEDHKATRADLHEKLFTWLRRRKTRVTVDNHWMRTKKGSDFEKEIGIFIGYYNQEDLQR